MAWERQWSMEKTLFPRAKAQLKTDTWHLFTLVSKMKNLLWLSKLKKKNTHTQNNTLIQSKIVMKNKVDSNFPSFPWLTSKLQHTNYRSSHLWGSPVTLVQCSAAQQNGLWMEVRNAPSNRKDWELRTGSHPLALQGWETGFLNHTKLVKLVSRDHHHQDLDSALISGRFM